MLLFEKLYDYLIKLKCTILETYSKDNKLRYVYFKTKNNISCLLYISSRHNMKCDIKSVDIIRWEPSDKTDYILTLDSENSLVKNIDSSFSPESYRNLLKRLYLSILSIPYKLAIFSPEYLSVLHNDGEVDTFYLKNITKTEILITLDLETLTKNDFNYEISRIYQNINDLLQENQEKYWTLLLKLLNQCQEIKIITNGKNNSSSMNLVEKNIIFYQSQNALKYAMECIENLSKINLNIKQS